MLLLLLVLLFCVVIIIIIIIIIIAFFSSFWTVGKRGEKIGLGCNRKQTPIRECV